jgi:hypothetical protein
MKVMRKLLRSLIAISGFVVIGTAAHAAKTLVHEAVIDASFADVGFLDFKTFLIGPTGGDDPALASERLRFVSPETILFDRARSRQAELPPGFPDLPSSVFTKRAAPEAAADELTIEVNGAPVTLSLGLRDALLRDIRENFRLYGVPALFNPMPGVASARYIGNAAGDIIRRIDAMEEALRGGTPPYQPGNASLDARTIAEPSSLSVFAFGLLMMGWLRRSSRREQG